MGNSNYTTNGARTFLKNFFKLTFSADKISRRDVKKFFKETSPCQGENNTVLWELRSWSLLLAS